MLADRNCEYHDRIDKHSKRDGGGDEMKAPTPATNGMLTTFKYLMDNPEAGKIVGAFSICAGIGITIGGYLLYTCSANALKGA